MVILPEARMDLICFLSTPNLTVLPCTVHESGVAELLSKATDALSHFKMPEITTVAFDAFVPFTVRVVPDALVEH